MTTNPTKPTPILARTQVVGERLALTMTWPDTLAVPDPPPLLALDRVAGRSDLLLGLGVVRVTLAATLIAPKSLLYAIPAPAANLTPGTWICSLVTQAGTPYAGYGGGFSIVVAALPAGTLPLSPN